MNRFLFTRIRIRKASFRHLNSIIQPSSNHISIFNNNNNNNSAIFFFPPELSSLSLSLSSSFCSSPSPSPSPPQSEDSSSLHDDDVPSDVTTQELKDRIGRYLGGDVEALPSIFEAILARKLSGKHEDTDDELMEEFRSKTQQDDDQELQSDEDSDEDLTTDSDEELSD